MKTALVMFALLLAAAASAQVQVITQSPHPQNPLALPEPAGPPAASAPIGLSTWQEQKALPGDSQYRPEPGQAGKDVIWVPTPDELVQAMLKSANVGPTDILVDLGSGDGRIAIAAARDFGARARGVEYNGDLVALANRNARRAGVSDRATFVQGDIFQTSFGDASVVTMYLLPTLNLRLRPQLLQMRPGTRIVSNSFTLGEWIPEKTISAGGATAYLWVVPANVGGRWAFEIGGHRFAQKLEQQFQIINAAPGQRIQGGRLYGPLLELQMADGTVLSGEVRGDQIHGHGWNAYRIKPTN